MVREVHFRASVFRKLCDCNRGISNLSQKEQAASIVCNRRLGLGLEWGVGLGLGLGLGFRVRV